MRHQRQHVMRRRLLLAAVVTALVGMLGVPVGAAAPAYANGSGPCARPTIKGTNGNDRITGTSGNDVISVGKGDDYVDGGGGKDIICGGAGNDTLIGGSGEDRQEGDRGELADQARGQPQGPGARLGAGIPARLLS
jgi:hypothetical protein